MSQEFFEEFITDVFKNMSLHLLEMGTADVGEKSFQTCRSNGLLHLRVKNTKDEVCLQVSGKEISEVANQLVLSCLRGVSIEQLRALHKRPLKRALQLQKS